MATHPCPSCGRADASKVLENVSSSSEVTYRRCEVCGHIWVTFRDGSAVHHVTPLGRNLERAS